MTAATPILEARGLTLTFKPRRSLFRSPAGVRALVNVDLRVDARHTVAVVGESGSGKSTLLRAMIGLVPCQNGSVMYRGTSVDQLSAAERKRFRRRVQIVFQDASAALDPRMTVQSTLLEPFQVHGEGTPAERQTRIADVLELVGLRRRDAARLPHEFSGGQRQRIGIARALVLEPEALLLDEPVSALDVSTQAQIVNLLKSLQRELGLAYVLVSHDLSVVDHFADDLAVMYLGHIVERGTCRDVLSSPRHPYTHALLSSVPIAHPSLRGSTKRVILSGDPPDPSSPPSGCVFITRCWRKGDICAVERPELDSYDQARAAACHFQLGEPSTAAPTATNARSMKGAHRE